jgi:hypothetical protein
MSFEHESECPSLTLERRQQLCAAIGGREYVLDEPLQRDLRLTV